jgi:type I restriction enzyme R subunit
VLKAFKVYFKTARLNDVTDPNQVFDLRHKLDGTGYYTAAEVERVVDALHPLSTQGALDAAISPIPKRLLEEYKTAQQHLKIALEQKDSEAEKAANTLMNALVLFKGDMGAYVRLYTFLSQMVDFGNVDIEKRAIFYKHLIPLLEFGREREGVDLSKLVLTHHTIRNTGKRNLYLKDGDDTTLNPISESGSGLVQEKAKVYMSELIKKVNELFQGELTDDDKLVYVQQVIRGKLLESATLQKQAASNTKEQFATSPDLTKELKGAIIEALDAHKTMSTQAINSDEVQKTLLEILLNHSGLWEALKAKAA